MAPPAGAGHLPYADRDGCGGSGTLGRMSLPPGWTKGVAADRGWVGIDTPCQPYLESESDPVHRVWIGKLCATREEAEAQVERYLANEAVFEELNRRVSEWDSSPPDP